MPAPRTMWSVGSEQFHTLVLRGLEEAAIAAGHSVLTEVVDGPGAELAVVRAWAAERRVDVVVLKDLRRDDPRPAVLRTAGVPFVLAGDVRQSGADAAVLHDNSGAMWKLLGDLLALGHRRIGHIEGPAGLLHSYWRREAYDAFVVEHRLPSLRVEGDYGAASGARATGALLERDEPPTVLVFDNDAMAIGGIERVRQLGLAVPRDISVVSWDDSLACQVSEPPLAVLGHRAHQLGMDLGRAASAVLAGAADGMRLVQELPVLTRRGSLAGVVP
ncbi:LacI family DNA-binding transcriptional regulator [Brachybacterium sacelli]|uniref:DNA-binding LacI/PurR family transcriptional regulator n=2 Tax=Brachybacterium sacelli TaxID=173364 RepID=A0ABS4WY74_9MICO|nr:substrate-binding domain-containing protein [Brachybacterium sacelli]MBP2381157.1 DNA-binding LacI/PurR family transcriptional regulator [Brachybacterium sacelli]